ncbi:MAG: DUF3592 domain-containing protein [Pirellulales bacterium]
MVQGVLLTLATATWGGVLAALVGAPAYRRPLLVAVPFAAFIATMIGFAVSNSRGGAILGMVAMFASAAALVAMLVAACGFEIEEDDNAPIDLETEEGVNRFFRRLRRDSEEYFDACEKRSWLGRYGLHVLFYSLFMAGAGISIFATSFSSMRTARQSRYWPAVDGVVTAVIARHEPDGNGIAKYHGRAVYQYTVNGSHYSADIMDFRSKPRHHDQFNATRDVPFDPGDSVRVYYNPNAPEEAVLVTGADPIQSALFTAACVMAVLGMVGFTISAMYFLSVRARKAAYLSSRFGPGQ